MISPLLKEQPPLNLLWKLGMEEAVGGNEQGKFTGGMVLSLASIKMNEST